MGAGDNHRSRRQSLVQPSAESVHAAVGVGGREGMPFVWING